MTIQLLAEIAVLKEKKAALLAEVERLQAENATLKAERDAAVEDMLNTLLTKLEKEKDIISKEIGRDYAHLNFANGRSHTLMRVKAWANIQMCGGKAKESEAK